jgi:hypothetical protein
MLQKEDLIAELKLSKDITGIKKLKVERAKVEEQQEKELFSEITRQLTANSFVEKVGLHFVLLATYTSPLSYVLSLRLKLNMRLHKQKEHCLSQSFISLIR